MYIQEGWEWGVEIAYQRGTSLFQSYIYVAVIKYRGLIWSVHVARMEEGGSAFKILTGKSTGKRPLGRAWRR